MTELRSTFVCAAAAKFIGSPGAIVNNGATSCAERSWLLADEALELV